MGRWAGGQGDLGPAPFAGGCRIGAVPVGQNGDEEQAAAVLGVFVREAELGERRVRVVDLDA
ncbi:hypothetical protein GCM10023084_68910 [Streptomyces lacrimifluminis]|uniref:Uncharacterized protein n=1 Tax=Streptomyces lacrimifluminis TaxID=1500077 RepID=A0A917P457_9ACTN|nr:hypothetical protein GCM10012282_67470 [Streptomyces lacrimifluminis]